MHSKLRNNNRSQDIRHKSQVVSSRKSQVTRQKSQDASILVALGLGVLVSFIGGCVTIYNPATQRNETLLIDTASEVSLGKDLDTQVSKKYSILRDPMMQTRLDAIGSRAAAVSDRQDLTYHFKIIKDEQLNAFAIPGGFIYVNSGLMNVANDDELAFVVGHEIGHVAARHSVKRMQAGLGYQIIMSIALGVSRKTSMANAMNIVYDLVNKGYSRQDELLADKLAVRYMRRSGFNPHAAVTFFEKLKKESNSRGAHYNPVFLSSHPAIEERIRNIYYEINNNS